LRTTVGLLSFKKPPRTFSDVKEKFTSLAPSVSGHALRANFRQNGVLVDLYRMPLAPNAEQKLVRGGYPVLRWMGDNVAIRTNLAGNIKADKEKSTEG
jgi:hypothetical protein